VALSRHSEKYKTADAKATCIFDHHIKKFDLGSSAEIYRERAWNYRLRERQSRTFAVHQVAIVDDKVRQT
jgi:hypothetical protein